MTKPKLIITIGKTEIYDLREFEKPICKNCNHKIKFKGSWKHEFIATVNLKKIYVEYCHTLYEDCGCKFPEPTYIIPKELEPYEIKKVSEIRCRYREELPEIHNKLIPFCGFEDCQECDVRSKLEGEHNLKEDDKIVIRVR